MNLDWYYTFISISKYKSYRKAAEHLFITQTAVFNRMKLLESYLGIDLFVKKQKKLLFTEKGEEFLPIALDTINSFEKGIRLIKNNQDKVINIYVSNYIGSYLMTGFVTRFMKMNSGINIALHVVDKDLLASLDKAECDIVITRKRPEISNYYSEQICEGKVRLAVPDTPENSVLNKESDYLKKYSVITDNHPEYWKALKQNINQHYPKSHFISISSVLVAEEMIALDQGISYLPLYLIKKENKKIKFIEPSSIQAPTSFTYQVWKENCEEIKLVIEAFKQYIEDEKIS